MIQRAAWWMAGLVLGAAGLAACGDSGADACTRECQDGFECALIDGGPLTTCVAVAVDSECDPPCSAVEQCLAKTCVPVNRTLTCSEALACLGDCPGAGDCTDRCQASARPADSVLLTTLSDCLVANGCSDTPCARANCEDALNACLDTARECGEVSSAGQCDGEQLSYCENDRLITGDCRSVAPGCTCGLDQARQIFDCQCPGAVCEPACPVAATCVDGQCVFGGFGGCGGLQPGQSVCEGNVLASCTGTQLQRQDCAELNCSCGPSANQPDQATCCP